MISVVLFLKLFFINKVFVILLLDCIFLGEGLVSFGYDVSVKYWRVIYYYCSYFYVIL